VKQYPWGLRKVKLFCDRNLNPILFVAGCLLRIDGIVQDLPQVPVSEMANRKMLVDHIPGSFVTNSSRTKRNQKEPFLSANSPEDARYFDHSDNIRGLDIRCSAAARCDNWQNLQWIREEKHAAIISRSALPSELSPRNRISASSCKGFVHGSKHHGVESAWNAFFNRNMSDRIPLS
jgi:hypothetical protein